MQSIERLLVLVEQYITTVEVNLLLTKKVTPKSLPFLSSSIAS